MASTFEQIQDSILRLTLEKNTIIETFIERIALQEGQIEKLSAELAFIEDQYLRTSFNSIKEEGFIRSVGSKLYLIMDVSAVNPKSQFLYPRNVNFIKEFEGQNVRIEEYHKSKQSCAQLFRQFTQIKDQITDIKDEIKNIQAKEEVFAENYSRNHIPTYSDKEKSEQLNAEKGKKIDDFKNKLQPIDVADSPKKLRSQNFQFAKNEQKIVVHEELKQKDSQNQLEWQNLFTTKNGKQEPELPITPVKKSRKPKIIYIRK